MDKILDFLQYLGSKIGSFALELIIFLCAFFAPAGLTLLAVGAFIAVDTYMGRWSARKLQGKKAVTSKKTRVGIVDKSFGYLVVVLSVFIMDIAFFNEIIHAVFSFKVEYVITKLTGLVFCFIEWTSWNEKYKDVKGISITEAFSSMLKKIKIVKNDVDDITK